MTDDEAVPSNVLERFINKPLEVQWRRASEGVASHKRRRPDATPDEIARSLVNEFIRDVTVIGATGGALSANPGPGAIAKFTARTAVETTALLERAALMIMGVAEAYGHDLSDIERRRYAILRVLGAWAGVSQGVTGVAGTMGAGLGKKATQAIPMTSIHAVNRAVNKQILFKWASRTGTIRLGSVLPYGIGAGLGASGYYVLGKGMGKAAIAEYRPPNDRPPND